MLMHVNILTLFTDKMSPPPHIYTQIFGHPCPPKTAQPKYLFPCSQGDEGEISASAVHVPRNCQMGT